MDGSKVHHCISQEMVSQAIEEPPAAKCRCRKYITLQKATDLVNKGEARWVVVKRIRDEIDKICHLCHADPEVKNCANCHGIGTVKKIILRDSYNNDIVLVSRAAVDKTEKKYRPALALKTPRVATIEENHIEMAYVLGIRESAQRIEEYGRLILDARMYAGRDRILQIKPEPKDNPKTGTGRNFDYGRTI